MTGLIPVLQSVSVLAGGSDSPPAHATGQLRLVFHERHPLNNLQEVCRRLDIDLQRPSLASSEKARAAQNYDLSAELLQAIVPASYTAGASHGLLVWTGAGPASPAWIAALSQHRLILISAIPEHSNMGFVRLRLPLDCVHNMKKLYTIDDRRVYIAGFSAGAGYAVSIICGFPEIFRGGCFYLGGRFYMTRKTEAAKYEPTLQRVCPQWKGIPAELGKEIPLVFVRAQGDTQYSPQEDLTQCTGLLLDGFQRVHFVTIPSGGHKPPDATWFERGLAALTAPPKPALIATPTASPDPSPGQVAQAQRILATARWHLEGKLSDTYDKAASDRLRSGMQKTARSYLQRVVDEYPTTPAAAQARRLLGSLDSKTPK